MDLFVEVHGGLGLRPRHRCFCPPWLQLMPPSAPCSVRNHAPRRPHQCKVGTLWEAPLSSFCGHCVLSILLRA